MLKKCVVLCLVIVCGFLHGIFAAEEGDALQISSYRVVKASERPDVSDGLIADNASPDDWQSAYVRVIKIYNAALDDTTEMTVLFANDGDSLYIAGSAYLAKRDAPRSGTKIAARENGNVFLREP